ncbi:PP0621 family protein [uncultured Massilia sp.]|uniref:PP0621 family protein n=1 Tax=uncultured Massilia sp. TaxID=169973 RepID=UPI0025D67F0C|nr:PP0621 family protein [uncultured Massilia sp.]
MTRLLFWIALVILVVMAVRSKVRAAMARAQAQAQGPAHAGGAGGPGAGPWRRVEDDTETMSNCAHCGIYFPSSEAVRANGRDYCSPAHAQLPPK